MDLDQDMAQISVKTCLLRETTVVVDTHLGEVLSDFMTKLRQSMHITMDQPLQVNFGCKTLNLEVTREMDMAYLAVPLTGGMQGAHLLSLIPFQGEGQKEDEKMAQSANPASKSLGGASILCCQ